MSSGPLCRRSCRACLFFPQTIMTSPRRSAAGVNPARRSLTILPERARRQSARKPDRSADRGDVNEHFRTTHSARLSSCSPSARHRPLRRSFAPRSMARQSLPAKWPSRRRRELQFAAWHCRKRRWHVHNPTAKYVTVRYPHPYLQPMACSNRSTTAHRARAGTRAAPSPSAP
jgi:hypothetical protein